MARRTRGNASTRGESWAILDSKGKLVREMTYGTGAALVVAQDVAHAAPKGATFYVEHRYLFGDAQKLYRVDHVEGAVVTTIIANTD